MLLIPTGSGEVTLQRLLRAYEAVLPKYQVRGHQPWWGRVESPPRRMVRHAIENGLSPPYMGMSSLLSKKSTLVDMFRT